MPDLLPRVPRGLFRRLVAVLTADGAARWDSLRRAFADGFRLLTTAVQEQGLHSRLRDLTTTVAVAGSPFYEIGRSGERLLAAWQRGRAVQQALSSWRRDAAACRSEMAVIHRQIDAEGVNLDTVFGLERIDRALSRLEIMADIISAPSPDAAAESIQQLLVRVAYFTYQDRRLRHLVDWNLKLLNRKIVERSGKTGEHYIATSRKEYWGIWAASAGGGLVTVFTAAGKLAITGAGLALFQEGFAVGLNYAVSFLVLQAFGLMLATKQPAMTAATLANIVRDRKGSMRYEQLLEFASRITFSQLASAIANVTVVFAGAYLFDFLWRLAAGSPFLAYEQARYVFETLSPINSGTIFYAAVTGVILWLASLIGGWFDNFTAYNRIPAGIADHPLGAVFGRSRMERAGAFLARNAAGWGTNISLGFLLGFTPAIGHFLGVPLDVRHVTLSSGMLALAAAALDHSLFQWGWFLLGATGILTMFVLNLSVSFLLSLGNAARAYGYSGGQVLEFLRRLARNFIRRPLTFILPPKKWVVPAGPPADKDAGPV
jgi:site-specific recombinase